LLAQLFAERGDVAGAAKIKNFVADLRGGDAAGRQSADAADLVGVADGQLRIGNFAGLDCADGTFVEGEAVVDGDAVQRDVLARRLGDAASVDESVINRVVNPGEAFDRTDGLRRTAAGQGGDDGEFAA